MQALPTPLRGGPRGLRRPRRVNYARSAIVAKSFEARDQPRRRAYVSPAGDFSVQLPGAPEEEELTKGGFPVRASAAGTADGSGCVVVVADYSSQTEAIARQGMTVDSLLGAAALSAIREQGVTVIDRRPYTHAGHPGTEIEFLNPPKTDNPADRLRGVARVVWARPRMYVALVSAPGGSELYAQRRTFLDAFRLLEGGG